MKSTAQPLIRRQYLPVVFEFSGKKNAKHQKSKISNKAQLSYNSKIVCLFFAINSNPPNSNYILPLSQQAQWNVRKISSSWIIILQLMLKWSFIFLRLIETERLNRYNIGNYRCPNVNTNIILRNKRISTEITWFPKLTSIHICSWIVESATQN